MTSVRATEKRLAVATSWALFAPFGLCFVLSGFALPRWEEILGGFALFVAGFISHVIINAVFQTGFTQGEVITGFVAFGVGLSCFIVSTLAGIGLSRPEIGSGIAGFAALILCFIVYMVTKFGLKGAFSQFHLKRAS